MTRGLLLCLLLLNLSGCSVLPDQPRSAPAFQFLYGPKTSGKLIIFVHGVLGNSLTWTSDFGKSWPELVADDDAFRNYRVATYRYDSPFLDRTSTVEEVSTRMLQQLRDHGVFRNHQEIYFIAHSMGGLVTKRVLVKLNNTEGLENLRRVKAVLYIATPAQGADLADLGAWVSLNPQFRDLQSANFNSYLQSLEDEWANLIRQRGEQRFPLSFCAYETKRIVGRLVVSRTSAATYCDEAATAFDEDHISIVKPLTTDALVYQWALGRIRNAGEIAHRVLSSGSATQPLIEVAPRVIHYVHRYKADGQIIRQNEYGFGIVARIQTSATTTEQLSALEITGEIDADGNDHLAAFGEGRTLDELDAEYGMRKPYYRVSFVAFPINERRITDEEFVKFMVLDPTYLTTQATLRGDEAEKYFGFRGENPREPMLLTTVPNIRSFVTFTRSQHTVPGNAQLLGPRLRAEIKSGRLQFKIRFRSATHVIDPEKIYTPALISLENWSKQTTQDIFFKNNLWDRAEPIKKDPLVESPR